MNTKLLAIIGVVAVVAIAAIAIGYSLMKNDNHDEVTDGVNYYGNGGTWNGKDVYGITSHEVSKNFFEKEGALFDSWNTKADGSGTKYQPGDKIDYKDGTSVRLYAIWDTNSHILMYNALFGTGSFDVSYNGKVLDSMEQIKFSSNEITLTVTSTSTGGKMVAMGDGKFEYRTINGEKVSHPCVTFDLKGNAGLKLATDGSTGTITITCTGSGDITLNANFNAGTTLPAGVSYMINISGVSGHETIKSSTVAENMFTDTGKTFVSWNTAKDGSGKTYMPGDTIDYYGYVILYAQWA